MINRLGPGGVDGSVRSSLKGKMAVRGSSVIDSCLAFAHVAKPVVLISGFWRSGTTWLQEALAHSIQAKTVFEPLSPIVPRRRAELQKVFSGGYHSLQAYLPASLESEPELLEYLKVSFNGKYGSNFTQSCRFSVTEAFRPAIVVKDVRAQLILSEINQIFALPVVHLRRDPCKTINSLLRAGWDWSFDEVSLGEVLRFDQSRTWQRYLRGSSISDFNVDSLSRAAALWAMTERFVEESLGEEKWATFLSYEEFASNPPLVLEALCSRLGLRQRLPVDFARPSASSKLETTGIQPRSTNLDKSSIDRILEIVEWLYPDRKNGASITN